MSNESELQLNVTANAEGVKRGFADAVRSIMGLEQHATKAGQTLDGMGAGAEVSGKKVDRATQNMINAIKRTTLAVETGGDALKKFERQAELKGISKDVLRPYLNQLKEAKRQAEEAEKATASFGGSLAPLKTALGGLFAGVTFGAAVGKLIEVQREFDKLNSSLITVTGSSANADAAMAWLKDFAKSTPFGLTQATEAFVKMKALGLEPTRASLTSFGNTASAMGKDLMQFVEAVADASSFQFERLREFGITAEQQGSKVALTFQGVTTTIGKSSAEITKYLEDIGNNQFAAAMEERTKTLDGAISELQDTWDELFRSVNQNSTGTVIYDSVKLATGVIEDLNVLLQSMKGYTDDASEAGRGFEKVQDGIAVVTETVTVLAMNAAYVFKQMGNELGGIAAQAAALIKLDWSGAAEIGRQMRADAEAARIAIDTRTDTVLNARGYARAEAESRRQYDSASRALDGAWSNATPWDTPKPRAGGGGGGGKKPRGGGSRAKPKDEFKDLYESLFSKTDAGLEKDFYDKLNLLEAGYKKGRISVDQYRQAVEQLSTSHEFTKKVTKEVEEAQKALNEQLDSDRRLRLELIEAENKNTAQYAEETQRMREQLEMLGLTEDQIHELAMSKMDATIADKEFQLSMMDTAEMCGIEAEALKYSIQALKDRRDVMGKTREVEKAIKANEAFAASLSEVNDAFKKAFTESTGDIGDMFSDLWKSALAGFKNLVYQMTIQPIIIEIGAMLTGNSYAGMASLMGLGGSGGGGIGGIINGLSSGQSLWSAISGNNPILNTVGSWLGLGGSSAVMGAGQGVLTEGAFAELLAGTLTEAGEGVGAAVLAGEGAGAGMSATAAGGMMAGGLFAAAMLAAEYFLDGRPEYAGFASANTDASRDAAGVSRDDAGITDLVNAHKPPPGTTQDVGNGWTGILGASDRPTSRGDLVGITGTSLMPGTGQEISTANLSGLANLGVLDYYEGAGYVDPGSLGKWDTVYNAEWVRMSRTLAEGVLSSITRAASIAGQEVDLSVTAGMYDDGKKDNIFGYLDVLNGGQSLVKWDEKVGSGQEYLRGVASATLDAFDALDLPRWADSQVAATREAIDKLDPEELGDKLGSTALAAIDTLNAGLAQTAAILTALGKSVSEFKGLDTDDIYNITQLLGGIEGFGSAYNSYVGNFYSEKERQDLLRRQVEGQFAAVGIALPDTREAFKKLVDDLVTSGALSTEAGQKTFATLMNLSGAFASLVPATEKAEEGVKAAIATFAELYETAQTHTDKVWAAFSKNQDKQIDYWAGQESNWLDIAEEVRGVFDLLHEQVRSLYDEVDDTRAMQTEQARAYIAQSLQAARLTGVLPDQDKLSEAIESARNGLETDNFSTRAEYEVAVLELAGQLSELEGYAGTQLTAAEQSAKFAADQVKLLTDQKDYWQEQFELLRETNTSLGTIEELAQAFLDERKAKEAAEAEAKKKQDEAKTGAGAGDVPFGGGDAPSGERGGRYAYATKEDAAKKVAEITAGGGFASVIAAMGGYEVLETTGGYQGRSEAEKLRSIISGGTSADLIAAMEGKSLRELQMAWGFMPDDLEVWLKSIGYRVDGGGKIVPAHSFDVGSPYIPRDMVAQLHQGEMVVKPMDSEWFRSKAGGGMSEAQAAELISAVKELSDLMGNGNVLSARATNALNEINMGIQELTQ